MEEKTRISRNGLGRLYDRSLGKLLPSGPLIGVLGCVLLNSLVYWGSQALNAHRELIDITTPLDAKLPFVPGWVFIYVGSFLFWAIGYVLMARQERWFSIMTGEVLAKLLCGVLFVLIPSTNVRPEILGDGLAESLMALIYRLDPPLDLFPSIHCLESWMCVIGLWNRLEIPRWYQIFSLCFAILVCISTLLTYQHVLADVFAGVLLAQVCYSVSVKRGWGGRLQRVVNAVDRAVFGKA